MTKLIVLPCADYAIPNIQKCVDEILNNFGGAASLLDKGKKVFIKVNLVREMAPEKCGTTHPSLVECIAGRLAEAGGDVTVGDSSGGPYTSANMNNVYRVCGIAKACENAGVRLNQDFSFGLAEINGKVNRHQEIINAFLDADVVLNVTKLKTHGFTGYTGAVKNLYGLIPGLIKAEVHPKFPDLSDFCENLIDLEQFASKKIVLHIVDAVWGMEGNGPTNGRPKFLGKIIASDNPYVADVAGVKLFDEPSKMPLLKKAVERGVIPADFGASYIDYSISESSYIEDFDRVTILDTTFNTRGFLRRFVRKEWLTRTPVIRKSVCRGCGKCFNHCPRQAIEMRTHDGARIAQIDLKKCIRCYCCQELCPFDAVHLKKPLLFRVLRTFSASKRKPLKPEDKNK